MTATLTHEIIDRIGLEKSAIASAGIKMPSKSPEQLVGLGFRFWMTGYRANDIEFWKRSWDYFARHLGVETARATITDLAFWVQTVHQSAQRDIEVADWECDSFNQDERMAITMIAASQHNACPALAACAYALVGNDHVEPVVAASNDFAHHLLSCNLELRDALGAQRELTSTARRATTPPASHPVRVVTTAARRS